MNQARFALLASLLFSLCLISACKTTEEQLRAHGFSPTLVEQAAIEGRELAKADAKPSGKGSKIQWFLLTAAILAGVIMVFASDRQTEKKRVSTKRPTSRKRRKR